VNSILKGAIKENEIIATEQESIFALTEVFVERENIFTDK
jgi:hypothetical protein